MRLYETSFLVAPTLPEDEAEKLIEKMAGIISSKKGEMINVDRWGKRRLAYPIKKFDEAVYVFFLYKADVDIPAELERNFKQTESVIRYLTIKKDERDNVRLTKKGVSRSGAHPEEPPAEEAAEAEPAKEGKPSETDSGEKSVEEAKAQGEPAEEKTEVKETEPVEAKEETAAEKGKVSGTEEQKEEEKPKKAKTPASKKKEETKATASKTKDKESGTKKAKEAGSKKEKTSVKEDKEK